MKAKIIREKIERLRANVDNVIPGEIHEILEIFEALVDLLDDTLTAENPGTPYIGFDVSGKLPEPPEVAIIGYDEVSGRVTVASGNFD